jgi:GT2 family glycosyltransferase
MKASVVVFVLGHRAYGCMQDGTFQTLAKAAQRIEAPIVYVDNYSRDGAIDHILEHYPECDVLMTPSNLLYCDGINAGLQYIFRRYNPDYYILSDADNRVEPDSFGHLLRRATSDPRAGIIQPLVCSFGTPGKLYSCGHRYDENHQCWPMEVLPGDLSDLDDLPSCSILSTLFRREVFTKCGLLDSIFRIYYESSDISFRARAAGWRCVCERNAIAYHQGNPGLDRNSFHLRYYVNRNWLIFWRIHDEERYEAVAHFQSQRLRDLQARFEASEFGLDAFEEAIRSGILDGLQTARALSPAVRNIPAIENYRKELSVLIATGQR